MMWFENQPNRTENGLNIQFSTFKQSGTLLVLKLMT